MNDVTKVDVRRLVFPLIEGRDIKVGFDRRRFVGTGFFVERNGLALTAAHVALDIADGSELRAALPTPTGPMTAHAMRWIVRLPKSDIAVCQVEVASSACFATSFASLQMGQAIETIAIPESMLVTDATGRTQILLRTVKGYVSYGTQESIAASFALPKGMSGAPLIAIDDARQCIAGVFVGQTRGEEIEDLVEEVIDDSPEGRRVHVERVSRVEYFARGELLAPHAGYQADEFSGLSLKALIERSLGYA